MKKLFATIIVASTAAVGFAATPLWMRDVKISPDGKQIAFCYKGDIYKVASTGGSAVRLTSHDSYESVPVWSPDGKQIAFASDRYGNNDVFIMNADGGSAVRLTTSREVKRLRLSLPMENMSISQPTIRNLRQVRCSPTCCLSCTKCQPLADARSRLSLLLPNACRLPKTAACLYIRTARAMKTYGANITRRP